MNLGLGQFIYYSIVDIDACKMALLASKSP